MSKETALLAEDKASDELITAVIDTVMAFVDVYVAAKSGAKALQTEAEAEAKLAGVAEKEAQAVTSRAALEGSSEISTETGHVHVTEDGRLVSCFNPCMDPRNRWARTLADNGDLSHRLDEMETKAADGVRANAGKEARDALAREYATLDDALAAASTRTLAEGLVKGMNDLVARFPFLKAIASDESALARLVPKRSTNALKGQLLEELDAARVRTAIAAGDYADVAARAGRPVEHIAGNDIREISIYRTKQGTEYSGADPVLRRACWRPQGSGDVRGRGDPRGQGGNVLGRQTRGRIQAAESAVRQAPARNPAGRGPGLPGRERSRPLDYRHERRGDRRCVQAADR